MTTSSLSPEYPSTFLARSCNEVFSGWRWPRVVGKVEANEDAPLEYAKIWRLAQARTSKPVMFGTVSSQNLPLLLSVDECSPYDQDDQRQLIWDMATVMNRELREVAAAGCKVIQLEEPLLHFVAQFHPENTEQIDVLVDAFNREVEGLENVEIWIHTCWGNPNMQRGVDNTFLCQLDRDLPRTAERRRLDDRGERQRRRGGPRAAEALPGNA